MGGDRTTTTVIVGGGHNGLAMSRQLSRRGVDHVVLERHEVAHSWRHQRWASFTMLTPNWQTRLPDGDYAGSDPDGFMTRDEIASFVTDYARSIDAPVRAGVGVDSVRPRAGDYEVLTDEGPWRCASVVLAGGASTQPRRPACAEAVPSTVVQIDPLRYRAPDDLPDGGVLVVGAAATGVQLAAEIHLSGRPVTLSLGEHVRMPRTYRARDIQFWMESIGRLDERYDEVEDIAKARKVASPQLVGTPDRRTLDLNALTDMGVRLAGRLGTIRDGVAMFSGGLRNHCKLADQKLGRLLDEIDGWIASHPEHDGAAHAAWRPEPTRVPERLPLSIDLASGEIATIVWATGMQPDHSWVDLPVFDDRGRLVHDGGVVVGAPGVYTLGSTFLRRRRSTFIHGSTSDTDDLADHLVAHLAGRR